MKNKKTIKVGGMMCEHCVNHVEEALLKLPFVQGVKVSLKNGTAEISLAGDYDENSVKSAIKDAGYEYLG